MSDAKRLADVIRESKDQLLLVVTGAGVSLASGIPTFRGSDPDAVWKRDITELGTCRYFFEDPVGSWRWYLSRLEGLLDKAPNQAHHALVRLERWQAARGEFQLVTQNIDTLHEQAGSQRLIKVHGSADRVRCSREGCVNGAPGGSLPRADFDIGPFEADPREEHLPRCPACDSILRQHVLWFDEYYQQHDDYRWGDVQDAAVRADLLLFVGTSLSVGVTDLFLRAALHRGVPVVSVDPGPGPGGGLPVEHFQARAEELLPQACDLLEAGED